MKKMTWLGLAVVTFASPVFAADMPTKAPLAAPPVAAVYNWTGVYVGGSAGWAHADINGEYISPPPDHHNSSSDSFIGGAHIGAQYQFNNWLVGAEAAYSGLAKSSSSSTSPSSDCAGSSTASATCTNGVNDLFTVGGRLGVTFNQWLLYGTGGYANGRIETSTILMALGQCLPCESSAQRQGGWYAGAGIDYMLVPHWIVGLEYQHIKLNSKEHDPEGTFDANSRNMDATVDVVRARLSYLFN